MVVLFDTLFCSFVRHFVLFFRSFVRLFFFFFFFFFFECGNEHPLLIVCATFSSIPLFFLYTPFVHLCIILFLFPLSLFFAAVCCPHPPGLSTPVWFLWFLSRCKHSFVDVDSSFRRPMITYH
mmetsp:Transcript_37959/g.95421  ORF Transcript_37959/g.95421 Transcript_37959/m.95421 type:complete len:123 (+) Transcript_37959:1404-1772(+)